MVITEITEIGYLFLGLFAGAVVLFCWLAVESLRPGEVRRSEYCRALRWRTARPIFAAATRRAIVGAEHALHGADAATKLAGELELAKAFATQLADALLGARGDRLATEPLALSARPRKAGVDARADNLALELREH